MCRTIIPCLDCWANWNHSCFEGLSLPIETGGAVSADPSLTKPGIVMTSQTLDCWDVCLKALLARRVIVTHRNQGRCGVIQALVNSSIVTTSQSLDSWVVGVETLLARRAIVTHRNSWSCVGGYKHYKVGYRYDWSIVGLLDRPAEEPLPHTPTCHAC